MKLEIKKDVDGTIVVVAATDKKPIRVELSNDQAKMLAVTLLSAARLDRFDFTYEA